MDRPKLSSACKCGAKGTAKHEVGKCPHLYHVCTAECGPNYKNYIGKYAAKSRRP